jgi:hypothetical protein
MITQNPEATAPAALEAAGQMVPLSRMFKPEQVKAVLPETKVVDEENLPLPVYRGYQTGTGRNKFTFYTDKPELADLYATSSFSKYCTRSSLFASRSYEYLYCYCKF